MAITYVERDGETVYRPPYTQNNTLLMGWNFTTSLDSLQRILDHDLNAPARGAVRYRAVTSSFVLTFANIRTIRSLDARDRDRGWIPEIDVCVWILAGAERPGTSQLDRLVWYVPYIWVDNPFAVATGRETLGYPKAIGWMHAPERPTDRGPFTLDALVLPTYAPETELVRRRVLSIEQSTHATTEPPAKSAASLVTVLLRPLLREARSGRDLALLRGAASNMLRGHVPLVFLKQFRDSATPDRACFQAIVEANATIARVERGGVLDGTWRLDLERYDSVRMRDRLGLSATTLADRGFWVDFSFSMDLGREVWRAS